jgi:hypothetical protein
VKIERFATKACCGKQSLLLKIGKPLSTTFLPLFLKEGFVETPHFIKAGILYIQNDVIIVSGPFGQDKLQLSCKPINKALCKDAIEAFEKLLQTMG